MGAFGNTLAYVRFLAGLRPILRRRVEPAEARTVLLRRMERREENFLDVVRTAVWANPRSPYRALLERAGCEAGDLERSVRDRGLEATLESLRDEGVYLSFEEFKGREPVVRGELVLRPTPDDFVQPATRSYYRGRSGGSTGAPRSTVHDLRKLVADVPMRCFADHAQDAVRKPLALWTSGLPGYGVNAMLTRVCFDNVPERWFSPTGGPGTRPALRHRAAQAGILHTARLLGAPVPLPEHVGYDDAHVVAEWMGDALAREGACMLRTSASLALRVALAARDRGIDLTGASLTGGGEPPTPTKVAIIESTGARFITSYHFSEVGAIGHPCGTSDGINDQHLLLDHLAMIRRRRTVPGFDDLEVDAFMFTTLLPSAPMLLLNVESDDHGTVTERACGCPFEELGMTTHLSDIRSFHKLTGEGVTLVGSDAERILESVLPSRFGGSPLDYQLVEEEDDEGFTRIHLVVSPRVELEDESEVIDVLLAELGSSPEAELSRLNWLQTGTVRVRRAEPELTSNGKFMPLRVRARTAPERSA